uniref:SUEL-type lectin domain-containing protein n=1 Tax=Sinocyclocheilus grahami TaxID=75366 RepID=A0A672KMR5_SINGR
GFVQRLSCGKMCHNNLKLFIMFSIVIVVVLTVIHYVLMFFFCSDTGVISVQSINTANYGRTDKIICSEGRPSEQLQNTNCYSPNALAPVSKSCNGLESCEVFATHTVFTDPCFGIYKYLAISYFCLPPGVREYLLPDLLNDGTVIRIHSANYGRTDSSTCCTGRPASQLAKTDCYALNSQTVVTSGCEGKNSCSILASNSVFSDPCVGTFKYLYISYSCVSKCKCDCTEQ